jgi:hypothetical protein
MALDHRIGNKVIKNARREEAPATRVDPYPYIGIVKNNLDPTRSGRLQVYIPDLGGPPDDPNNWRTVSYASPFQGYTDQVQTSKDRSPTTNTFTTVSHSYGMWMVPPDINVEVIVIFIAGDPLRGYWIACVNSHLSHYMIPAMGGTPNVDPTTLSEAEKKLYLSGTAVNLPVVEFNEYQVKDFNNAAFYNNNKPVHKIQLGILQAQGLDRDPVRGAISSSSQRESPSRVFGISTPGRPINDPADDKDYLEKLNAGTLPPDYFKVKSRKGGHVFVMDDGAALGEDQLVRLRTAGGHQLLLHDTNNTIYIGHADGTSWIEMTSDGSINAYATGGFNVRSEGTINLHTDSDFNINAVGDINISAGGKFAVNSSTTELLQTALSIESNGKISLKAGGDYLVDAAGKISQQAGGVYATQGSGIYQNSGKTVGVSALKPIQINKLPDTQGFGQSWNIVQGALESIVTVAPSHEPYYRGETGVFFKPTSPGIQPQATYTNAVDATKSAQATGVQNPAEDKDIRNQPPCDCTLGNLNSDQLTAYFAQIGKSESGGNYAAVNSIGYAGKYQFGYPALIDGGYVKNSCKSNAQLKNPNTWTGKNGIDSLEKWLASPAEQESAMCAYTKRNYTTMCKIGAVTGDQSPEDVAGMLAVSHLLGPGGAKNYRNGQNSADAYGTTGATYFNKGKYAVAVLAPKVPTVNAG